MDAETVCGTNGGESYMATQMLTRGISRNIWILQNGLLWDFGEDEGWTLKELKN